MYLDGENTDGTRFGVDYTRNELYINSHRGYKYTLERDHILKRLHMRETIDI